MSYASTATARTSRVLALTAATAAAAAAFVVVPAAGANAATTCASSSCITNFETQRSGLSMAATFDTTVPTTDTLTVYKDGALVATTANPSLRLRHQISSPATLAPNTAYTYHLTVKDQLGNVQEKVSTITTQHRRLDVLFTTIAVTKDSDSGGAGDFRTRFAVGPRAEAAYMVPETIASPSTVLATQMVSVPDVGTSAKVMTEMYDTDLHHPLLPWENFFGGYNAHPFFTSGYSPAADWSTAVTTLNTTTATATFLPFQMQVNDAVGFVVRGQYMVSYWG